MLPIALRRATLSDLPAGIDRPRYDPAALRVGILHLGLGAFHRAHMARYTHALMQRDPAALGWGIAGAGLLPADRAVQDALVPQDGLYTLVERDGVGETAQVIGAVAEVIYAGDGTSALLARLDDPAIRIVSLTVSENGYCLHPATRRLDPGHAMIRADLADPAAPRSAIGVITEALRRRRAAGQRGFTALSCDNIQHNGDVLRAAVLDLAALRDPALAAWIADHASFPNTMVDRITPATRPDHVAHLATAYGIEDRWPVFAESFTQWVIEDRFVAGRPAWEEVGAQFVPDVAPYEMMKLRLLNASHLAVAGLGHLLGHTYVHEAMAEPLVARFMAALMARELAPALPPVPGVDLGAYQRTLVARFANPAIADTVERINRDAAISLLVTPITATLAIGGEVDLLALGLAAWMRRVGSGDAALRHPEADLIRDTARAAGPDPMPLLRLGFLFGDLAGEARLVALLRRWLDVLHRDGARSALEDVARRLPG